ncbi:hypothetical protein FB45DRAFT_1049994 [Roridomyces roridus]|uniref:Uncharacterized protein n=1 Tax=Roridomyces roridus TaxID=1738132 RepID=A0AAD7CIA2_9AGAR|nr:hypothetical protein FB45DRAFT_1049994 [Roridomyces roridus]
MSRLSAPRPEQPDEPARAVDGIIPPKYRAKLWHSSLLSPSLSFQMAFIENGTGFTLGEGTYNNIQGDLNIYHGTERRREEVDDTLLWETPALKRRRDEEDDDLEVIRQRDLSLLHEIGGGPGYLFHAAKIKDRAVIVKVFNTGARAREHLEVTFSLSRALLHPNVLRIEAASAPTSPSQLIVYQDAHWKNAEGSLAAALRDDLDRSVVLGFKLVAGLSSGINYLSTQDLPLALGAAHFDVFLDVNDRFLLSINPPSSTPGPTQRDGSGWTLFNALCQKVLRSANRLLHDDDIERTPVVFKPTSVPNSVTGSPTALEHSFNERVNAEQNVRAVAPRREYIWRTMALQQPLATIAAHINRDIDIRRKPIHKLVWTNAQNTHRCPGYVREEITLATTTADSAVVVHDSPDPRELCPICHQVVNAQNTQNVQEMLAEFVTLMSTGDKTKEGVLVQKLEEIMKTGGVTHAAMYKKLQSIQIEQARKAAAAGKQPQPQDQGMLAGLYTPRTSETESVP